MRRNPYQRYRIDDDRPNRETQIERMMRDELTRRGVSFVDQARVGRYRPDFLLPGMIVVECDGPHHEAPARQAKDRRRDAAMIAAGYTVYRFSHTSIRQSVYACVDQIIREHHGLFAHHSHTATA